MKPNSARKLDLIEVADNRNISRDYADASEDDTSPTDIQRVTTWPAEESGDEEVFDHVVVEDPKPRGPVVRKKIVPSLNKSTVSSSSYKTAPGTGRTSNQ